jgi:peptide/nickel transport system substrate-binding protein
LIIIFFRIFNILKHWHHISDNGRGLRLSFNIYTLIVLGFFLVVLPLSVSNLTNHSLYAQEDSPEIPAPAPKQKTETKQNPDKEEVPKENLYPMLEEMQDRVPSAKDLALKPPIDWIVIESNRVMPVMQVFPRPNTLEKMFEAIRVFEKETPPRTTKEEIAAHIEKRKAMLLLEFSIYEDANLKNPRLFLININRIKAIIYYEELMLRRIHILRKEFRIRDAFELLHQLRRRTPDWKGIDDAHDHILFSAAEKHARAKQFEDALVKLEELQNRNPRFRQLSPAMGKVINSLIQNAVNKQDYRKGRYFIRRLRKSYPDHEVIKKWVSKLTNQCRQLIKNAENSYQDKKFREATVIIKKAAIVWPRMPGLLKIFNRMCQRYQILRVGVLDQPSIAHSPIQSEGNSRYVELTESHLFELDHMEDVPHYRTKYFEKWTPTDLGRQVVFDLRPGRSYWESQPVVSSSDLISTLKKRLNPNSSIYDQRLQYFIKSISINSPHQFEIVFSHVPLKPEALFRFPYPATVQTKQIGNIPNRLKPSRFQLNQRTKTQSIYTRVKPEPNGLKLPDYHLSEISETQFANYDKVVQGLIREQIDLIPKIPPSTARTLSKDERFFVIPYSVPEVHVIQFNPKSKAIRNRQIRKAMAYGLNLPKILKEKYLNSKPYLNARMTSAPFAMDSYAFNKTVEPRSFDLSAAVPLVLITKKKLGGSLPELKMLANPEPMAMKATIEIVKRWNQIGIPVRLIDEKEKTADWDIAYRSIKMTEPIVDLWAFVANDDQHKIESLTHLPDWLRGELIQLERTSNLNSAIRILQNLHRHLYEEVEYIPLWEIYHHLVVSKKVSGFSEYPISPYHNIERWNVTPWFSRQYQ